jgi:hypothetical protein
MIGCSEGPYVYLQEPVNNTIKYRREPVMAGRKKKTLTPERMAYNAEDRERWEALRAQFRAKRTGPKVVLPAAPGTLFMGYVDAAGVYHPVQGRIDLESDKHTMRLGLATLSARLTDQLEQQGFFELH